MTKVLGIGRVLEHHPRRLTHIPVPRTNDIIEVSSVHFDVHEGKEVIASLNETCVFFPNGNSDVRGTYYDHDKVVAEIRRA